MGFWDEILTSSGKLIVAAVNIPYDLSLAAAVKIPYDLSLAAVKIPYDLSLAAVKIPYDLSLAAVYKISESVRNGGTQKLKQYLPEEPDRREKLTRIATNIGQFAVESAINESLKGVRGALQVYKIVQEGLKDPQPSLSSNHKKPPEMKELEEKMKKMQEEMNKIKAGNNTAVAVAQSEEPNHMKKIPAEPVKTPDLLIRDKKRVLIRSRL